MPSLRMQAARAFIRVFIRRESWGADEAAVARRARRWFGAWSLQRRLRARGVRIEPFDRDGVRGEWVSPPAPQRGVILYLHGGGYVSCSPATHRPITCGLARLASRRVFALDYRLAPEHRFPAALDDALAAYRRLLKEQPDEPLAVCGDSAGGGLSLALLVAARDEGLPLPACAVLFSPWTDMTGEHPSVTANDGRCDMFRSSNVREFARIYLGDADPRDPRASPARADLSGLPPVMFQVGAQELLFDDAAIPHGKILAGGGRSTLHAPSGVFHAWQWLDGVLPEARAAMLTAVSFIDDAFDASSRESPATS